MMSMLRKLSSGVATAALLLLALSPAASAGTSARPQASSGPRLTFDEQTFDFDKMYQEDTLTHEFKFRNTGNAPLIIEKIIITCGCAAALPPQRETAPGATSTIKVTFRAGRMRDKVTKHLYVDSNDPVEPRVTLTFTGVIKREVDIIPSGVFLASVKVGETIERDLLIRPVDVKTFHLSDVTTDHQAVHASDPEPINDKLGGYRLKVRFGPVAKPERINAHVFVRTDLEHAKLLRIPVYGKVTDQQPPAPPPPAR